METRRQEYRAAHLKNIQAAHERGQITFAAAFADPVDGAVVLFDVHSAGEVFDWIATDPYNHAGLIRSATVREVNVGIPR
jgi:uncharacterized protein YciI